MTKEILLENARRLIVEMNRDLDNVGENLQRARKLYDFFLIADFIRQTEWMDEQNEDKRQLEKEQEEAINRMPEDLRKTKAKIQEIRESQIIQRNKKEMPSSGNLDDFQDRVEGKKREEKEKKSNFRTDFISVDSFSKKDNKSESFVKKEEPKLEEPKEPVVEKEPKVEALEQKVQETETKPVETEVEVKTEVEEDANPKPENNPLPSAKPRLSGGKININLNDRIAFINMLFDGDREMFLQSIQKLEEIATEQEAQHYINHSIKPYYANWEGREDYEARFLEVVMFKFQ